MAENDGKVKGPREDELTEDEARRALADKGGDGKDDDRDDDEDESLDDVVLVDEDGNLITAKADGDTDDKSAEELEAKRKRRRDERKAKKQRAAEARREREEYTRSLERQLAQLGERVSGVENFGVQTQLTQLDSGITRAEEVLAAARRTKQEALAEQDYKKLEEADEAIYNARVFIDRSKNLKQQIQRQTKQPRQIAPDPVVARYTSEFQRKHTWFNANGNDTDSRIAMSLDTAVAEDGFDPKTPEYWAELEKRMATYLPHRVKKGAKPVVEDHDDDEFEDDDDEVEQQEQRRPARQRREDDDDDDRDRRSKPSFVGGSGSRTGAAALQGKKTWLLSKARREAMAELGLEPGTPEWMKQIKAYQKFDKQTKQKGAA